MIGDSKFRSMKYPLEFERALWWIKQPENKENISTLALECEDIIKEIEKNEK